MAIKIDDRQIIDRTRQDQLTTQTKHDQDLSGSGGKKAGETELDNLMDSVNSELTPPLRLDPNEPADRVVNIGASTISNPETLKKRNMHLVKGAIISFAGGTLTFPANPGSNIVNSAGADVLLSMGTDEFIKVLVQVDSASAIVLSLGSPGISEAAATNPTPTTGTTAVGLIVVQTVANAVQNINYDDITQFDGVGSGIETVEEDTAPTLGGDLTLGSNVLIHDADGMKRGTSASDFIEEEYVHSIALVGSQTNTVITELTFAHASFEGLEMTYKLKEATSGDIRLGTFRVVTNGTTIDFGDDNNQTADTGITFDAVINGANVEVRYSSGTNGGTLRADLKRFKA